VIAFVKFRPGQQLPRSTARVSAIVLAMALAQAASATPPTTSARPTQIVEHLVLPGERLQEISERYDVTPQDIVRWNQLDPTRPILRVNHALKVHAINPPPPRVKVNYRIRPGDSWSRIARNHQVNEAHLRKRWNPKMGSVLRAGEHLTIWVEGSSPSAVVESDTSPNGGQSQSIGKPTRGRIQGLAQLPVRPDLYTVRTPQHSYGGAHAIALVQQGVQAFRSSSGFEGPIWIGDMSQRHGGRFRPHRSHQSGRDVDIRLLLQSDLPSTTIPTQSDQVDWDSTWKLVKAMLDTGQVVFIFLSNTRQKHLHAAAVRAGASPEFLTEVMQYPRRAATAIIRHSRGHTKHFHVRFTCADYEARCRD